jgi:uncharacterized protein YecT (DUF1311 family)
MRAGVMERFMRFIVVMTTLLAAACASAPTAMPAAPITMDAPESQELTADRRDLAEIGGCVDYQAANARTCIGAVTRRCSEAFGEGASTTGVMVQCAAREERAWASMLDALVAETRLRESPTQIALLDTALAQGEAWTAARCAHEASIYEGGSLARVVAVQCRRDVTAERAISLYQRIIE